MYCSARCKQRAYRRRQHEETRSALRLVAGGPDDAEQDPAEVGRQIERACLDCLLRAVQEGDVRAAIFILRARWPNKWGAR
jgi:hypothetical protein